MGVIRNVCEHSGWCITSMFQEQECVAQYLFTTPPPHRLHDHNAGYNRRTNVL